MKKADYSICPVCKDKIPHGQLRKHLDEKHPDYKSDYDKHEVLRGEREKNIKKVGKKLTAAMGIEPRPIRISETAFASQVEDLLNLRGWHWAHFRPAMTDKGWRTPVSGFGKGFLDYIALRPPRILVIELKDSYKNLSPEQEVWWEKWRECQLMIANMQDWAKHGYAIIPEVYLWRPSDIDGIIEILK